MRDARLLAAALALLAMLPATAARKDAPPPRFVPHVELRGAPPIQGSTWLAEAPQHALWLKQVDDTERQSYIEHATGLRIDPFGAPPGQAPRFLSFLLVIENRGETPIEFNPLSCWLVTNTKEIQSPIGLNDLAFTYRTQGLELPPAYEKSGPAIFDLPRSIPPGQSISGLLVYRNVKPRTRRFTIDTKLSLGNGEVSRFSAPYRRQKSGEMESP